MRKREIIKELELAKSRIDTIINGFNKLDADYPKTMRHAQNTITFGTFELVDNIGKVEVSIYNYLKRKGWK